MVPAGLDEAYLKHHFWVRPKLERMPSDYYRTNGASSLGEDQAALDLVEQHNFTDNFMWANDYPHHEGSWPHSAEAIQREMTGHLRDHPGQDPRPQRGPVLQVRHPAGVSRLLTGAGRLVPAAGLAP